MEKVGYINKDILGLNEGLNSKIKLNGVTILYDDREILEQRNDVVQPICAGVIMTKDNKVLVLNKNSKATGINSPEKDKSLLYIGGHLDAVDGAQTNLISCANGMVREIAEETGVEISIEEGSLSRAILTYTPTSEKSARHFGVIFPVVIEKAFDTTFTDGKCRFVDIESLSQIKNFESWSEIIKKELVDKTYSDGKIL